MINKNLSINTWPDYELLDSGDNKKLERFGEIIIIRPETQAIWKPLHPELWKSSRAQFRFEGGKGSWTTKGAPHTWNISWNDDVYFSLRLTSFKHIGIFPEQASNWEWIRDQVKLLAQKNMASGAEAPKILNLFGYTGGASMVAAKHGAIVTHLDASKQSNMWAKENAALSNISPDAIRYILDDAGKFVEREIRRGSIYDGIILDPPAFGRGPDGEVWKIEEGIIPLLNAIKKILSQNSGSFFLLNGYAAGYAPQSLLQSVESSFPEIGDEERNIKGEFGELRMKESNTERFISSGIYVRFTR